MNLFKIGSDVTGVSAFRTLHRLSGRNQKDAQLNSQHVVLYSVLTQTNVLVSNLLGILACLDGYMNIALEQTEEYVNGQLKNKYGDTFIRGNNGKALIQWIW